MADLIAAALTRIEARHARFVEARVVAQVIARQRRELVAEIQPKTQRED